MDDLAATYRLVYAFLTTRSHPKAALELQRAVKHLGVLRDDIDTHWHGPRLDEIVRDWKASNPTYSVGRKKVKPIVDRMRNVSGDSDASSHDDSGKGSSQEESSSSDSSQHEKPRARLALQASQSGSDESEPSDASVSDKNSKHQDGSPPHESLDTKRKKKINAGSRGKSRSSLPSASSSRDSSSSSSDSSESESTSDDDTDTSPVASPKSALNAQPLTPNLSINRSSSRTLSSGQRDSTDSSSEEDDSDQEIPNVGKAQEDDDTSHDSVTSPLKSDRIHRVLSGRGKKRPAASSSSSNSSSSSDSDSDSERSNAGEAKSNSSAISIEDARRTNDSTVQKKKVRVTKKRRTAEDAAAVPTPTVDSSSNARAKSNKHNRNPATHFKRIDPEKFKVTDVPDNSYQAKRAPTNDYGQKAHRDLIVTRGAGFRKEKNKKKRGSYRGGEITLQSHSFKFTDE